MATVPNLKYWVVKIWPDGFRQVVEFYASDHDARWNANRVCRQPLDGAAVYIETRDRAQTVVKREKITPASKTSLAIGRA